MRTIERTSQFKRDYRREMRGQYAHRLDRAFVHVIDALVRDFALEPRYVDHALTGHWKGLRDCHVFPDLILLYEKPDAITLRLIRLGSHSELSL